MDFASPDHTERSRPSDGEVDVPPEPRLKPSRLRWLPAATTSAVASPALLADMAPQMDGGSAQQRQQLGHGQAA